MLLKPVTRNMPVPSWDQCRAVKSVFWVEDTHSEMER